MQVSLGLLGVVTVIYAAIALNELWVGRHGVAIVFAGYCVANVGLMMQVIK